MSCIGMLAFCIILWLISVRDFGGMTLLPFRIVALFERPPEGALEASLVLPCAMDGLIAVWSKPTKYPATV